MSSTSIHAVLNVENPGLIGGICLGSLQRAIGPQYPDASALREICGLLSLLWNALRSAADVPVAQLVDVVNYHIVNELLIRAGTKHVETRLVCELVAALQLRTD